MAGKAREKALRQWVSALVDVESTLASALTVQLELIPARTQAGEVLARCRDTASAHHEALTAYLRDVADATGPPAQPVALLAEPAPQPRADAMAGALCWDYKACSAAVSGYIVLSELALRLYEPALRELAPEQLHRHAGSARRLGMLLVDVAATELAGNGLHCHCVCPMCSIGACGCVTVGRQIAAAALPDPDPEEEQEGNPGAPGVRLPEPRPGSQLAAAQVRAGERLVAVDGEAVSGILDVQQAIRRHAIGESLTLQVQRVSGALESLEVTHVGDYAGATPTGQDTPVPPSPQ
jgi:hypothetical protein